MNIRAIIVTFRFPLVILVLSLLFLAFDVYPFIPWVDIPLHIVGAFALARAYMTFTEHLQEENKVRPLPRWAVPVFILSLVMLTAVVWEFAEYTADALFSINMQPSNADTMGDLFLGLVGSTLALLIAGKKQ